MTREEAIKYLIKPVATSTEIGEEKQKEFEAYNMAIEALQADAVKRVDCSSFLLWLLEEIMDEENWELNAVAEGEIIARKLKKLGLLEVKDGYYHRIFDENVWVVRCKDCIHWKADNEVFELGFCCVFPQKWVAETFYCADGERREPAECE